MADRKFDLVETISNLLKRIEEGRQTLRAQGGIFEEFRSAVERRERAFELWRVSMSAPLPEGEPARGEAERERESLKFEYERLNKELTSLWHKQGEIVAFVGPFANDVALLADRLPLTPEWNAYRGAIQRLSVSTVAAWHPPTSPDLGTLELRLIEMLALAAERPPRHNAASGANREPDKRNAAMLRGTDGNLKRAVTVADACRYGGVEQRAIQKAVRKGSLEAEGKGPNRRILVQSLMKYFPPENNAN